MSFCLFQISCFYLFDLTGEIPQQTQNFSKEKTKIEMKDQCDTTEPAIAALEITANLCYLCTNLINVYCSYP